MTNAVTPASLTAVAAESAIDSCCQLLAVAEEAETKACETKACETVACETATTEAVAGKADSCCSEMMADQAAVTSVALTTEATDASEPCCFDKGAKAACDEAKACCQENFGMADTPSDAHQPDAGSPCHASPSTPARSGSRLILRSGRRSPSSPCSGRATTVTP
jgi:hypothetical protein